MGHIIMGIGGFVLLAYAATQDNPFAKNSSEVISVDPETQSFTVSDNKRYFEYQLSAEKSVIHGIATMTQSQRGIKDAGALITLHYFDEKSAKKFSQKYAGSGQCPAPFFNRHAKQKLLMASNPEIAEKLRAWKNGAYKDVSGWQDFKLTGRCLTKTIKAEVKGKPVRLPRNFYSRCLTFHVEAIEYSPRNVSS
ncbi:hypothetical protein N9W89_01890 [Hellea sp.]|nr:hypothetical protein [Hellea sp.]